jgi:hypothetical protein
MAEARKIVDHLIDINTSERVVAEGDSVIRTDTIVTWSFYYATNRYW